MAPKDREITLPDTPLAKIIADALRPELEALEGRLCEALVNAVSPRLIKLERDTGQFEAELTALKERVEALEERWRHRDTLPAPSVPPMGGE